RWMGPLLAALAERRRRDRARARGDRRPPNLTAARRGSLELKKPPLPCGNEGLAREPTCGADYMSMPPMPPPPPAGAAASFLGFSAMSASVVSIMPATDAAFC